MVGELYTAEMEFLSGCLVLYDYYDAKIITKKEYSKARQALSERREHFSGGLETHGKSGLDSEIRRLCKPDGTSGKQSESKGKLGQSVWAAKMCCGVCGDAFGHRTLCRQGYKDDVWA